MASDAASDEVWGVALDAAVAGGAWAAGDAYAAAGGGAWAAADA